jgi:hypothetical protein
MYGSTTPPEQYGSGPGRQRCRSLHLEARLAYSKIARTLSVHYLERGLVDPASAGMLERRVEQRRPPLRRRRRRDRIPKLQHPGRALPHVEEPTTSSEPSSI